MRRRFWNRTRAGLRAGFGQLESWAGGLRRDAATTAKLRATSKPALRAEPLEARLLLAAAVSITAVDPDLRNMPVNSIAIEFTEPVNGFDVGDLIFTRDGELLTGAQLTNVGNQSFSLTNLDTVAEGAYQLTLDVNNAGIRLVSDMSPLPLDDLGVTPGLELIENGTFDSGLNGWVISDPDGVRWQDGVARITSLHTNINDPNLPDGSSGANIQQEIVVSPHTTYRIEFDLITTQLGGGTRVELKIFGGDPSGVSYFAGVEHKDFEFVTGAGSAVTIQFIAVQSNKDFTVDNVSVRRSPVLGPTVEWTMDTTPPTATISAVDRDPRNTGVEDFTIAFSEPVTEPNQNDFELTRDGGDPLSLSAAQLTSADNITWTLSGLSSLTETESPGIFDYKLKIPTAETGIKDLAGNPLGAASVITWRLDTVKPVVTIDSSVTQDIMPELTGTVDDPQAMVSVRLVSADYPAADFPAINHGNGLWTLPDNDITPPLPDGIYDVLVTATDVAGNAGIDDSTNELDVDGIPIVTVDELITSIGSPELTGDVNEGTATLSLTLNGKTYVPINNADGTWRLPAGRITPPLAEGTYDVAITATDVTNHVSSDDTVDELTIGSTVLISEIMADAEAKDVGDIFALRDYYYQSSDWIELFNFGSLPINLEGWALTDNDGNLDKWLFGAGVELPAGERLVVFASERNEVAPNGELHTNFKLSDGGEYLALVRPDGQVIHEFAPEYPGQFENISYGFAGDGETLGFMETPTPGEPNATVFSAVSRKPTITNAADGTPVSTHTFTDDFSIVLSSPEPGAVIRYTTEDPLRSNPTPPESWTLYTEPINISSITKLRTISFVPGQILSKVRAEAFFKVDAGTAAFTSNLPILMIDTFRTTNNSVQTAGHMAFFEPSGVTGLASVSDVPTSSSRIGFKWRGSSSANFDKHPYALELWEDGLNDDRNISLAGMPAESDWVLQGPWNFDRSFTRNSFIYELSRQVGTYAARTQLIEVFVNRWIGGGLGGDSNVNLMSGGGNFSSDYVGVYVLIEKIKQGNDRVDTDGEISPNFPAVEVALDPNNPGQLQQGDITGGYMFKVDRPDPNDSGFTAGGQALKYVTPKEDIIETPAWDDAQQYLSDYLNAFRDALNAGDFTHPTLGLHYSEFIDVQSFLDHHILNELTWNVDAFVLSTYYKKVKNGKIHAEPVWDFDRSAGSTDGRDQNAKTPYGNRRHNWWGRLLQDPEFGQAWIDRWTEWRRDEFSDENMAAIHDALGAQLIPDPNNDFFGPAANDERRWNRDARQAGGANGGSTNDYGLDGTVQGEIDHIKGWLAARSAWIDTQFLIAPTFSNDGGEIAPGFSISMGNANLANGAPAGTIWYTLDGSDPREPGGGTSANAFAYDADDPDDIARRRLNRSTVVTARVYDADFISPNTFMNGNEEWSGLTSGIYTVDRPTLTISEINYNPQSSTADEIAAGFDDTPIDGDSETERDRKESLFEFVEIHNFGDSEVNLALDGVELTKGVTFDFSQGDVPIIAPGDYVVVAFDSAAFRERYPDVSVDKIAGEFAGRLKNGGERLTLENRFDQELSNFKFEDGWFDITDGDGFTLSRRDDADTFTDLDIKRAWRPSSDLLGSPGEPDSGTQPAPGAIVINEILTHSDSPTGDWIELLNTTSQPIDISGWYLSDEGDNLRKYRFPDDTMVPGGTVIGRGQFRVINQFGEGGFGDNAVDLATNPDGNPGAFGLSELGDSLRLSSVDPDLVRENIDAAHELPGGNLLISTGGAAVLGDKALTFGNGDLIEYDPGTGEATLFFSEDNFLVFDPVSMTFIPGSNEDIDAASIDPVSGRLVLSTDGAALLPGAPGTPQVTDGVLSFGNGDLVAFDQVSGTATLLLSEAVFTGGNENIDAVHVRGDGSLIISTAGPATIDGTLFDDGDLIEIIPGNNADLAAGNLGDGTADVFLAETVFALEGDNLEPTEDIDAVYVSDAGGPELVITLSTNSDATLVNPAGFTFRNGDLVGLTPSSGEARLAFEENPAAGKTFLGEVAGYREEGSFGAAERDVTFGLHLKSDGTTDFTAQIAPSQGFANAAPLVGPVVINEIMYHPVSGEVEYIELLNTSGGEISLLDWQFTNGVGYAFLAGASLEAGEHILMLPEQPSQFANFAAFEADFRADHNVPNSVQIFGPYSGSLDNNGEALELSKPGDPEPGGFVPMILVDRVRYDNRLPWPVDADGGRSSLSRVEPTAYGSDYLNWATSAIDGTPGRINVSLDDSPPSAPENLSAVVHEVETDFRITVSWDDSIDSGSGVAFYRVLRNGQVVESNFLATTYVDNDVEPNVTFNYKMSAVNGDNFESDLSSELPVNILDVPTVVATEVTQFKVIFDAMLDVASATNISNYVVTGPSPINITGASVDAAGRTVTLTTSPRLLEDRTYSVAIENVVASTPGSQLPFGTQVNFHVPDLTLPTINAVQLFGSNWSPELLNRLEADGQGDDDGFAVPTGPDQLKTITWPGVDTVVIHFSEHVIVREGDLVITGLNRAGYPFSDFQYEAGTFIATWTLPGAIVADKLVLNLKDSVHDPGDNAIDGNWTNGNDAFPSGNGQRESDDNFQFRLNVLPGDVDGSEDVGRGDLLAALRQIGRDASDAGYDARVDVTADGRIDADDLRNIVRRHSTRLPSGEPSPANSLPIVAADVIFSRVGAAGSPAAAGASLDSTAPQAVDRSGSRGTIRRDVPAQSSVAAMPQLLSSSRRSATGRRARRLSSAAVDTAMVEPLADEASSPAALRSRTARRRSR